MLALEGLEVAAEVEQASGLETALAANPCDILLLDLQMEQWSMDQIAEVSRKTAIIVLTANESIETGLTALRLRDAMGIHGDDATWKLISCLHGRFYLVVVNYDQSSPQYRQWEAFTLSDKNRLQVLVPPRFGKRPIMVRMRTDLSAPEPPTKPNISPR